MDYTEKYVTEAKAKEKLNEKRIVLSDNYYALVEAINALRDALEARR